MELILRTDNQADLNLRLYSTRPAFSVTDSGIIYSDMPYKFILPYDTKLNGAESIECSVDGFDKGVQIKTTFPFESNKATPRFDQCICTTQLRIVVKKTGSVETYWSNYVSVMIPNDEMAGALSHMADHVYDKADSILAMKRPADRSSTELDNTVANDRKGLEAKLASIKRTVKVYQTVYPYFVRNARSQQKVGMTVGNADRLRSVSTETIAYIATHPEELYRVPQRTGITVRGVNYLPNKTLVQSEEKNYDIYENSVVVSFLRYLFNECDGLMEEIRRLKKEYQTRNSAGSQKYVDPTSYLCTFVDRQLSEYELQLTDEKKNLRSLYEHYKNLLQVQEIPIQQMPRPSASFHGVLQYRMVFDCMQDWFLRGGYPLAKEKAFVRCVRKSKIYEYYVLLELIQALQQNGFHHVKQSQKSFPGFTPAHDEDLLDTDNIFEISSDKTGMRCTLYYQPVIYTDKNQNGINLYRNSRWIFSDASDSDSNSKNKLWERKVVKPYSPDYLLKMESEGKASYWIFDAKFSTYNDVREKEMISLILKYIFSISAADSSSSLDGMSIIYGRRGFDAPQQPSRKKYASFHEVRPSDLVTPFVNIFCLCDEENIQDARGNLFDVSDVIKKMADRLRQRNGNPE